MLLHVVYDHLVGAVMRLHFARKVATFPRVARLSIGRHLEAHFTRRTFLRVALVRLECLIGTRRALCVVGVGDARALHELPSGTDGDAHAVACRRLCVRLLLVRLALREPCAHAIGGFSVRHGLEFRGEIAVRELLAHAVRRRSFLNHVELGDVVALRKCSKDTVAGGGSRLRLELHRRITRGQG